MTVPDGCSEESVDARDQIPHYPDRMGNLLGLPCVLCGNGSTRVGEHIWPAWFIDAFDGQGPFEPSKGGRSYISGKSSTTLKWRGLPGVHVPMCAPCNALLNTRFEVAAKPVVLSLLSFDEDFAWPTLSAIQTEAIALWLLKVGLLSAHPDAVHDIPHVNTDPAYPRLDPFLHEWISWMNTGSPPPEGFSVYVTRRASKGDVALDRRKAADSTTSDQG